MPSQYGAEPLAPPSTPAVTGPDLLFRALNGIREAQRTGLLSDQDARALANKVVANLGNHDAEDTTASQPHQDADATKDQGRTTSARTTRSTRLATSRGRRTGRPRATAHDLR